MLCIYMVHGRRKTINIHNAYTYLYTYTHSISYYCDVGRKLLMKTWHLASNQCCFETPVNWCVFTNDRTKRINYSQSQNKIHIPNNKFSLNVTLYHPKYFHPDQYQFISFGVKVCVNLTLFLHFFTWFVIDINQVMLVSLLFWPCFCCFLLGRRVF